MLRNNEWGIDMLRGVGIATITIGIIATVVALLWGIISTMIGTGLLSVLPALYGACAGGVILVLFVGNGLMMIRVDQLCAKSEVGSKDITS